ncbi:unnamed protein product [Ilex paraguariensis]|uniref:Glycosyltransferase n=1 Tax=Ilex paraguariensis TaxID=185542 RepID=A0ABC8T4N5_9AQUA
MEATQKAPHIAILPTPGIGHLIPLTEFAKRLLLHHHFRVTFIIPTTDDSSLKAHKAILEPLPENITSLYLPPVSLNDLPKEAKLEKRIALSVTRSLPAVRQTLKTLTESTRLSAFVVDMFCADAIDVAQEFGVPGYVFYTSSAMALSYIFYLPKLDETCSCEYRDLPEPVKIPGCVPVHGKDLPDPVQDRDNEVYKLSLHRWKRYNFADGILVNSFSELEPGAFKALKEDSLCTSPVYSLGPLIQTGLTSGSEGIQCLRWLDEQPRGSVLFVSFGSGGTLSHNQLIELALGLEMSQQRFLWVVRSPDNSAYGTYFNAQSPDDPSEYLPNGFLERTKDMGLVVPSWAPQMKILGHSSTGGFLTHCGWNSILESMIQGVPLIAWPLFAEQRMNATMLTDDLMVGLRVEPNKNGVVERHEIGKYVRSLIGGEEGKQLRNRMNNLKEAAAKVMGQEGSSTKSLAKLAQKWEAIKSPTDKPPM